MPLHESGLTSAAAGDMITSVAFQAMGLLALRRIVGWLGLGPDPDAKDVELAVLQHQVTILRGQVARPRFTPADRLVLGWLASVLPRERWSVLLMTPATLLRWHRMLKDPRDLVLSPWERHDHGGLLAQQ
jgi:hypothetical protein